MNERIKELLEQAGVKYTIMPKDTVYEKFAELIVRECKENFDKVWYEQGLDIRGAEISKFLIRFDEYFGVK